MTAPMSERNAAIYAADLMAQSAQAAALVELRDADAMTRLVYRRKLAVIQRRHAESRAQIDREHPVTKEIN